MKSSSFRVLRAISFALLVISIPAFTVAESLNGLYSGNYESPRMATYDDARGETTFALSMMPQVDNVDQRASDIVIFVDTSASQSGIYKQDSIKTLQHLLSNLSSADRVKLYAVDLDPVALTRDFVRPDSDEIKVAIENLAKRVSLGSTDMTGMLKSAVGQLKDSQRNRNIIYIGDGISRAGLLHTERFQSSVERLINNKISVSSYAIGPERNIELLASLANASGGNIFIDTDQDNAMEAGAAGLANTVHGTVFWPQKAEMPAAISEVHPTVVPPLRSDRDTILVGKLAKRGSFEIKLTGHVNGETKTMVWPVTAEESSVDFSFLPRLIEFARKSGGMMPTVGSAGLIEVARTFSANSNQLVTLSNQALLAGDADSAKNLAEAALETDPLNPNAIAVSNVGESAIAEEATEEATPSTQTQDDQQKPAQQENDPLRLVDPEYDEEEVQQLLRQQESSASNLLDQEDKLSQVKTQKMKVEVQLALEQARKLLNVDPQAAMDILKNSLFQSVEQTPDPTTKAELRSRVESAIMEARREQIAFDNRQELLQRREAAVAESRRNISAIEDREEMMSRLLNRFDSLLAEGEYEKGQQITQQAFEQDFNSPEANAAYESARVARYYVQQWELRRLREYNLVAALYEADKSATAFPGNPPLVFPDPVEWAEKVARRKKYSSVRLAGNANDERILDALDQPVDETFNFDETPFEEVMDYLRENYKITVVLDASARDDSLSEDEPVTFAAAGIRLKNALRLMLKEKNATYIVRNEVLQIISLDVASDPEFFVTNVYNVGDLVAPRMPIGGFGGMGGMGGGGMGGFGGGGMGGMGGGGMGGMGGGGMGGMGGGGLFCIQDSLSDTDTVSKKTGENVNSNEPAKMLVPEKANTPFETWSSYFDSNFATPADVRFTIRKLNQQKRHDEVIGLIQAALKHNQSQSWMYEAMVISMQISDWPKTDIERALMSTVDLSDQEQDALVAAEYMARNGMEKRALQLLQDLSLTNSTRPELFVVGLRAAQAINDFEGIQWAALGILGQAWPDHPDVWKKGIYAAKGVRKQLEKEGRTDELLAFNKQLDDALYRDCIIKVSWTGDADVDIFVEEPGGTICSRNNQRTTAGGVMMGDAYSTSESSGDSAEYYLLPKGFSGDYRLLVKKIWGKVTSGKVTVTIYTHFGTDKQASQTKQLEVDESGTLVLFNLKDGRRADSLEDHAIRTVAKNQMVVNRNILAQAFDDFSSPYASSQYYGSRLGPVGNLFDPRLMRNARFGPGAVGYRPELAFIPEGAMLSGSATTADRLFVLVNMAPNFSQIVRVDTFNILGDAGNAAGGGQGVGGIGGGIGGGGGNIGL